MVLSAGRGWKIAAFVAEAMSLFDLFSPFSSSQRLPGDQIVWDFFVGISKVAWQRFNGEDSVKLNRKYKKIKIFVKFCKNSSKIIIT